MGALIEECDSSVWPTDQYVQLELVINPSIYGVFNYYVLCTTIIY